MLLGERFGLMGMNPLPIQPARIHPPLLRHDVLSRERLNGWLDRAVEGRVALIIAEAGFGKTTLLADWARQTRRATAWYRLEPDDRDWLAFIRHLVAEPDIVIPPDADRSRVCQKFGRLEPIAARPKGIAGTVPANHGWCCKVFELTKSPVAALATTSIGQALVP